MQCQPMIETLQALQIAISVAFVGGDEFAYTTGWIGLCVMTNASMTALRMPCTKPLECSIKSLRAGVTLPIEWQHEECLAVA